MDLKQIIFMIKYIHFGFTGPTLITGGEQKSYFKRSYSRWLIGDKYQDEWMLTGNISCPTNKEHVIYKARLIHKGMFAEKT